MVKRLVCTIILLAVAVRANAQSGSTATSTAQSSPATQTSSPSGAEEAVRPATATFFGDTGLWFVPTGEVLPAGKVAASGYRRGSNYIQGFTNVGDFAATVAYGLGDRAEIFGSFLFDTRVDRDLRPLFQNNTEYGSFIAAYPRVNQYWTGNNVGDLFVGGKFNLLSQFHQKPVAAAIRAIVKLPTGDESIGVSTGKTDALFDFVVSKETDNHIEASGYVGFETRGQPDGFDIPTSAFRWGVGVGVPARKSLRGTFELTGVFQGDEASITAGTLVAVDGSIAPVFAEVKNRTRANAGLTWQHTNGFYIGGGLAFDIPTHGDEGITTEGSRFGDFADWQVRLGYHPGVRVYVPPPPPRQEPPPPAPVAVAPAPAPVHNLSVTAACDPCTVEVGRSSTVTATVQSSINCGVTYRWTAPSGTFANGTARQSLWTAGQTPGVVPVTITVTCPSDNRTATANVNITVVRPTVVELTFEDVYFDFDRSTLRTEALRLLDDAVAKLAANPTRNIVIEGHTCNIGTAEYNLALGDRRAASVRDYLVSRGVATNRLEIRSYGEERPKFDNAREETRRLNRRAALVVRVQ